MGEVLHGSATTTQSFVSPFCYPIKAGLSAILVRRGIVRRRQGRRSNLVAEALLAPDGGVDLDRVEL